MSKGPARFKQSDVTRAFKAAKKAGVEVRVDIAPDGRMSIIPRDLQDPPQTNKWDDVLGKLAAKVRS